MTDDVIVQEGKCRSCNQTAIRVIGWETYHPAADFVPPCKASIPIGNTGKTSFRIPADQFAIKHDPLDLELIPVEGWTPFSVRYGYRKISEWTRQAPHLPEVKGVLWG